MNTRLTPSRLLAILLTSTLALPASAGSLYKSIDAAGLILVSDVPPPLDSRIIFAQGRTGGASGVATAPGMPYYEFADSDEAVARANLQVDLAEHAFAMARQGLWTRRDGLRLVPARVNQGDEERVAFYKRGVQVARQQLMDLLRERQARIQLADR